MICVIRDPGPVTDKAQKVRLEESNNNAEEEVGLTDALAFDDEDDLSPGRWCRKCWVSFQVHLVFKLYSRCTTGAKARKGPSLLNL